MKFQHIKMSEEGINRFLSPLEAQATGYKSDHRWIDIRNAFGAEGLNLHIAR